MKLRISVATTANYFIPTLLGTFSRRHPGVTISLDVTNPVLGLCVPGGPARCRRINVTSGGQITACDPAATTVVGDTRVC